MKLKLLIPNSPVLGSKGVMDLLANWLMKVALSDVSQTATSSMAPLNQLPPASAMPAPPMLKLPPVVAVGVPTLPEATRTPLM